MRLVTLDSREVGGRPAIWLRSGDILDLAAPSETLSSSQWRPQSVVNVIAAGEEGLSRIARVVAEVEKGSVDELQQWRKAGRLLPFAGTQLMTPVRRPGLLLMVHRNPDSGPVAYVKNPNSATGPHERITIPGGTEEVGFGVAMVGLVLGRPMFEGTSEQAVRSIAAVTLVVDIGSQRLPNPSARQFPGSCVIGPAIVTMEEWAGMTTLVPAVRINSHALPLSAGVTLSDAATVVAGVSAQYALRPGDVIAISSGQPEFRLGRGDRLSVSLTEALELRLHVA